MRRRAFLFVAVMVVAVPAVGAQPTPPEPPARNGVQAVRATIDALFDGMRAAWNDMETIEDAEAAMPVESGNESRRSSRR